MWDTLTVSTHNINGIKQDITKIIKLEDWCIGNHTTIMGLAETNIDDRTGEHINKQMKNYKSFWSSSDPTKLKGSGVALLINKHWEKHIGAIDRLKHYAIAATFYFKGFTLTVIQIYHPPNNIQVGLDIIKFIKELRNKKSNSKFIIMGDFNSGIDQWLDKRSENNIGHRNFKRSNLIEYLINSRLVDTFRILHPRDKRYTWTNGHTHTRIDGIWITEELQYTVFSSAIISSQLITDSDHKIVMTKMDLSNSIRNCKLAKSIKTSSTKRIIFEYDKADDKA
jgi:exonuclease III